MAPSSLIELDLAIELFRKGAVQSLRARKALVSYPSSSDIRVVPSDSFRLLTYLNSM